MSCVGQLWSTATLATWAAAVVSLAAALWAGWAARRAEKMSARANELAWISTLMVCAHGRTRSAMLFNWLTTLRWGSREISAKIN